MPSLPLSRRTRAILLAGFALGLLLRLLMLPYKGTFDMDTNARWGQAVLREGLAGAYAGNYFPLAYQLFGLCEWIASHVGINAIPVYKAENLVFDAGCFWILVVFSQRMRGGALYALLYWLHPWFLTIVFLGYVDSHFTFCLLLWLWLVHDASTPRRHFVAGIPLALAVMMKPQAVFPVAAVVLYAWFRRKDRAIGDVAFMLAPLVLIFGLYELYFMAALWSTRGAQAMLLLPVSYVRIGSIQPVLTAYMMNFWVLVAYVLRAPTEDIWNVSSKLHHILGVQVRFLALALTLFAIAWYAWVVARARSLKPAGAFFYLTAFTSVILPALMTSAHENHLFLGTTLMILLLAARPRRVFSWSMHAILLIQYMNLEMSYGRDPIALALRRASTTEMLLVVAVISAVLSGVVVWMLYADVARKPAPVVA